MKLTIRKSGEDWYVIERAEHDGRTWLEGRAPNVMALCSSSRISDADVEGTAVEMLALAHAIRVGDRAEFRRCAVDARLDPVRFWSPRNSQMPGEASRAEAEALAREIEAALSPAAQEQGGAT